MRKNSFILFILSFLICIQTANAQDDLMQWFESMSAQAITYTKQKEYVKSIECYKTIIKRIEGTPIESLTQKLKEMIAVNHLRMGADLLKSKDYESSKQHLDTAASLSNADAKIYPNVQRWLGNWCDAMAMNKQLANKNLQEALVLYQTAEKHFELAKANDKCLDSKLSQAKVLRDLNSNDEAEELLIGVISSSKDDSGMGAVYGQALVCLGNIELESERYQQAIDHLEQGFDFCLTANKLVYAQLAANSLHLLYTRHIPEKEKETLWGQRYEELKQRTTKDEK